MQASHGRTHSLEQIAFVQGIHQMGNHFGVGLAFKHIALGLQFGAQFIVVFNDAVVNQCHPGRALLRVGARAVAEVRVRVVYSRCAVSGPTGMGNACARRQPVLRYLSLQFGHACGAARALQAGARRLPRGSAQVHSHAARVISPVFQTLQTLHQHRDDIARGHRANNSAHKTPLCYWLNAIVDMVAKNLNPNSNTE